MTSRSSLLETLLVRRVFQWTIGYVVGAWALLELMDFLSAMFGWPPVVVQITLTLLAFGLPAALVLAWHHGEKGRQEVTRSELVLLGVIAALGFVTAGHVATSPAGEGPLASPLTAEARERPPDPREAVTSLAVLPFVNLSGNPDEDYFADGVTEDLINQLSRLPQVRVISRTSIMQYRNTTKGLVEIGRELGVDFVLEGSARRAGDQVRIVAQLVDARSDEPVWSGSYDRELSDILRVQGEVAVEIAEALHGTFQFAPVSHLALNRDPVDGEAYRMFLEGRRLARSTEAEEREEGLHLLAHALELDPSLHPARMALAEALLPTPGAESPPERGQGGSTGARVVITRVLEGPSQSAHSPEPRESWPLALVRGDTAAALELAEEALRAAPNDAKTRRWYGMMLAHMGETEEAMEQLEIARALDPFSHGLLADMGEVLAAAGRVGEVHGLLQRLDEVQDATDSTTTTMARARLLRTLADSIRAEVQRAVPSPPARRGG
jgi:TolB-like protein